MFTTDRLVPHLLHLVRDWRRGLNLYIALFSADFREGGRLPVTQSLCNGFLERRAFLGSLFPFLPRYNFPFFAIGPMEIWCFLIKIFVSIV